MRCILVVAISLLAIASPVHSSDLSFVEGVMHSCYQLRGDSGSLGTVVMVACTLDVDSEHLFLVSARHVFDAIRTDSATLFARLRLDDGDYATILFRIRLRDSAGPLYHCYHNETVDLAGLRLPPDFLIQHTQYRLTRGTFATHEYFQQAHITVGDKVLVLGYPFGWASETGMFPLLKSGIIASFPLLPIEKRPVFYIDGTFFSGNSGGPVILEGASRVAGQSISLGGLSLIIGLVSFENRTHSFVPFDTSGTFLLETLKVTGVINSHFVLDLLAELGCK